MTTVFIPLRTGRGLNNREHHFTRYRRTRSEHFAVGLILNTTSEKPSIPCLVTLVRVAPGRGLDDDNLQGSLKGIRDAVAGWFGIDDALSHLVRYAYSQRRGEWGVEIHFSPMSHA